jgi:hypothetical protein
MFLGPLAAMFILGMFCPRVTGAIVLPVTLLTQLFSSTFSWWAEVPRLFHLLGMNGAAEFWPTMLGLDPQGKPNGPSVMLAVGIPCLFGIALGWGVGQLAGRRDHPGMAFTWRAVLKRSPPEPNS